MARRIKMKKMNVIFRNYVTGEDRVCGTITGKTVKECNLNATLEYMLGAYGPLGRYEQIFVEPIKKKEIMEVK